MEKWFFPPLSGGDKQGLNNSGVAMFKGIDSLTRETIQNVLDNPSDPSKPRTGNLYRGTRRADRPNDHRPV